MNVVEHIRIVNFYIHKKFVFTNKVFCAIILLYKRIWEKNMNMKTISERIFELLKERKMTQKEFARRTGIAESSISDWKKKKTNPVSDKILIICEVLGVSPEYLLSGAENGGERSRENTLFAVSKDSELGYLIETYQNLDVGLQKRVMGYLEAISDLGKSR